MLTAGTTPSVPVLAIADSYNIGIPYDCLYTTAWAKGAANWRHICTIAYSDGSYGMTGAMPNAGAASAVYNSGTAITEKGLYFSFPGPVSVSGFWIIVKPASSAATFTVNLYDGDGTTVLASATPSPVNIENSAGMMYIKGLFSSAVNLAKNTNYRLTVQATSTNNISITELTVTNANMLEMLSGSTNFIETIKTSGAWGQTTTVRPFMGLILSAIDDATGGAAGGMIVHPGMSGGFRA